MNRQAIIEDTLKKLKQLPDSGVRQVNDFAEFLLSRLDDKILQEGIQELVSKSESFRFLEEEEDIYTLNDLKERYK